MGIEHSVGKGKRIQNWRWRLIGKKRTGMTESIVKCNKGEQEEVKLPEERSVQHRQPSQKRMGEGEAEATVHLWRRLKNFQKLYLGPCACEATTLSLNYIPSPISTFYF